MSDFGTLLAYAIELEAEVPPAVLAAKASRPSFMPLLAAAVAAAADNKEAPKPAAGSKRD